MRYDPKSIEPKWQERWLAEKLYEPDFDHPRGKGKFYNLMMFPYPSAEGLHVGNMYAFTGADIYGRFKRMQGYDVFEPIGLDGFGIHSENYALSIGAHPADQAKISKERFYEQLGMIGNGFAWGERLETYDPEYYRWTQWIFAQMFKRGLAYRKKAAVNWCPSCLTVLADEQVLAGQCERCGTKVVKKELEQWFFKITAYAERLLKNLETIDWSEKIKVAQRNWIGRSEGAEIEFPIAGSEETIKVFTTRPDTLFGATYMVLGPEHPLIQNLESRIQNLAEVKRYVREAMHKSNEERIAEGREKTGVELKGITAINPANNEEIPVWVADYVLGGVGTGAIMAVPAHDERDFAFAKKFGLLIREVVSPAGKSHGLEVAYVGPGALINSGSFTGMDSEQAKWTITTAVGGERRVQYRLRDWLISRQRYWGPPIPMIFCETCHTQGKGEREDMAGWYPVPENDLPVELPYIENFRPTGTEKSPLATVESFYKVKCPSCGAEARRETDVSDTFLDSAWYYLRYPSVRDSRNPWDPEITKKWLPVDAYIGGPEHAVLHLLYVRFLAMVFHDWSLLDFEEPFTRFFAHAHITKDGAKMSKSKGNIVTVDDYVRPYGVDAGRMYLIFLGPFEQGGDFRDTGIRGITRFLERVWRFSQSRLSETRNLKSETRNKSRITKSKIQNSDKPDRMVHKTIRKVTNDIEGLQYNTAIAALMVLLNAFEEHADLVSRDHVSVFLRLLAPFAPHITDELWHQLGENGSIHRAPWPEAKPEFLREERITLVVQVDGRVRDRIEVAAGADEASVRASVLVRPKVGEYLKARPLRRFIYIPNRIVNLVTK